MKKICFVAFLFVSQIIFNSDNKLLEQSFVENVHKFLQNFNVARTYAESKDDFLQRLRQSNNFCSVVYQKNTKQTLHKNDEVLDSIGLFTTNAYAIKLCGYWGDSEDGFHVKPRTQVIGKNLARLEEKGHFEWSIQIPGTLQGNEFQNTPIQPLFNYLLAKIAQKEYKFIIPIKDNSSVSFVVEEDKDQNSDLIKLITRLQHKK